MEEHSRSNSHDLRHILRVANVYRICKSFITKCYPQKRTKFLNKAGNKPKIKAIEDDDDDDEFCRFKICMPTKKHNPDRETNLRKVHDGGEADKCVKCSHDGDKATGGSGTSRLWRSLSMGHIDEQSAAIIFSNSRGLIKPPAMEKDLDCTLEELCFGCIKNISVKRNAVKDNGRITEEEETMTIKVEAGWRRGTKITFKGKGNQRPGSETGDLIFMIAEKEHSLFKRDKDDLQIGVEILLVDALTGCTLLIPLLGGQTTGLTVEDVVHPGYKKAIQGEGMPKKNEPGERGKLIINISVKFPEELTQDQRSSAAKILQQSCY